MHLSRLRYEFKDDYEWVRVVDTYPNRQRVLHFEDSIQGAISLDDHQRPVIEYISVMAKGARALKERVTNVLIGGLGGCGLLHAITSWCKKSAHILTVESNPRIPEIARRFFRLDPKSRVVVGDLRTELSALPEGSLDLALIDCYTATSIPLHLTTLECHRILASRLTPNGLAVFNLWNESCNDGWGDQLRTLLQAFGHLWFAECREDRNTIVFAAKQPMASAPFSVDILRRSFPLQAVALAAPCDWPKSVTRGGVLTDANVGRLHGAIAMLI